MGFAEEVDDDASAAVVRLGICCLLIVCRNSSHLVFFSSSKSSECGKSMEFRRGQFSIINLERQRNFVSSPSVEFWTIGKREFFQGWIDYCWWIGNVI